MEELLYDIEALSKDIMNLQTQCTSTSTENEPAQKKPFRSELNLILAYPNQQRESDFNGSSETSNSQITPPVPAPMELLTPSSHTNPMFLQNLPPPFSSSIPSSPLTPPANFKTTDANMFDRAPDFSHLQFPPINAPPLPNFSSNNSIFCTVSAPSTPASDRKCIDKFCINETNNDNQRGNNDKKKAKRVSIVNTSKDEPNEKISDNPQEVINDSRDADNKDKKPATDANGNHHSHMHRNHSHGHIHPKRRMSLDNNLVSFNPTLLIVLVLNQFQLRTRRETKITGKFVTIRTQKFSDESRTDHQTLSKRGRGPTVPLACTETTREERRCLKGTATVSRLHVNHRRAWAWSRASDEYRSRLMENPRKFHGETSESSFDAFVYFYDFYFRRCGCWGNSCL